MAFDCMRAAFLTRCIAEPAGATYVRHSQWYTLNAQRAQDCFDSQEDTRHRLRSRPPGMAHAT